MQLSLRFIPSATIYQNQQAALYRGLVERSKGELGSPALLRVSSPQQLGYDFNLLAREHDFVNHLSARSVLKSIGTIIYHGTPALLLENFNGDLLANHTGIPMSIEEFLHVSLNIATALSEIHREQVIHKDIRPENILIHSDTDEVKITGFGIATRLPSEQALGQTPELIQGTLPYISPEQTGRLSRTIDQRTDLYSLGITLYQMLTGELPFQADDLLGWIHCQVARQPIPPDDRLRRSSNLNFDPKQVAATHLLSQIVMKLLAKEPANRYQTAQGLTEDLSKCLTSWKRDGTIAPFPLGELDISGRLQIPQKIYGREAEINNLLATFEQTLKTGLPQMVLISGESGLGKSVLAHELDIPIAREGGFLGIGKSDQNLRDIPYSILVPALRDLLLSISSQTKTDLAQWRKLLQSALQPNAQLLIDLIPSLEELIGKQPPIPEISPTEAKNRLREVFLRFLGVFAKKEHPIVLLLDDLQWADPSTLELLQSIATQLETGFLVIIGTYRTNEVGPKHPLRQILHESNKNRVWIKTLDLKPLSDKSISELLGDTLHYPYSDVASLARLVNSKTKGNPFFVTQFLRALYQDHLIWFDPSLLKWHWNIQKIASRNYTDNVVEFMLKRVQHLPSITRDLLALAACIGNTADAWVLSQVSETPEEKLQENLKPAVSEELIWKLDGSYRFLHDQIQHTAYSLLTEQEKAEIHLNIGKTLSFNTSNPALVQKREERLFEIANHFLLGASKITLYEDKIRISKVLLKSGQKAKATSAYSGAVQFLSLGIALLKGEESEKQQHGWYEQQYDLIFQLYLECAECEWLRGNFENSERLLLILLSHARTLLDQLKVYRIKIMLYRTLSKIDQAVESGLNGLRLVGLTSAKRPSAEDAQQALREVWDLLGQRPISALADLPFLNDEKWVLALEIASLMVDVANNVDLQLFRVITASMMSVTLRYGNTINAPLVYSSFSMLLSEQGQYREAYEFGNLAYQLTEKQGPLTNLPRVYYFMGITTHFWFKPYRELLEFLRLGARIGTEMGDLNWATYCALGVPFALFLAGEALSSVAREQERTLEFCRKFQFSDPFPVFIVFQELILTLQDVTDSSATDDAREAGAPSLEERLIRESTPVVICTYYVNKIQIHFFSRNYELALVAAEKAREWLWSTRAAINYPEFIYYESLSLAARFNAVSADIQSRYMETLLDHEATYQIWSKNCPQNFASKHLLISAEIARLKGYDIKAQQLYEKAIQMAKESGLIYIEAISCETAANFYISKGLDTFSKIYLRNARSCFTQWGATRKARDLGNLYPNDTEDSESLGIVPVRVHSGELDFLSIVKASQSISTETDPNELIYRLVRALIEQSRAQRGCFLGYRKENFGMIAEAKSDAEGIKTKLFPTPSLDPSIIPQSIVEYVLRTKERVILNQLSNETMMPPQSRIFLRDNYLREVHPKSLLCLPLIRGSETLGVLYLENNLISGAFTPEVTQVLAVLASQAAISLDVAFLLQEERISRSQAQNALRVREEFALIASHELRTPLTPLKIQLQTFKKFFLESSPSNFQKIKNSLSQLLDSSELQVERLSKVAEDLLNIFKIGPDQLIRKEFDLSELVREIIQFYEPTSKKFDCKIQLRSEQQVQGQWDRSRIERVISHLLDNAIKFGPGNPIKVSVEKVTTKDGNGFARLTVQDYGIGIEKQNQERIFQRFERAVSVRHFGGFGLGLYLSQQIVQAHGGQIRVESSPGLGATFTIELPLKIP